VPFEIEFPRKKEEDPALQGTFRGGGARPFKPASDLKIIRSKVCPVGIKYVNNGGGAINARNVRLNTFATAGGQNR